MRKRQRKKTTKKNIVTGQVHIQTTYNNTIVTVTDDKGDTISFSSAGVMGFRGAKKSTPYAAKVITNDAITKAIPSGLKEAVVYVKGPGIGRESAIRTIAEAGIKVKYIKDVSPIPHNGCRPKKRRRV